MRIIGRFERIMGQVCENQRKEILAGKNYYLSMPSGQADSVYARKKCSRIMFYAVCDCMKGRE